MAVPRRRNGYGNGSDSDEDDIEIEGGDEGWVEAHNDDVSPDVRRLVEAAENGDIDALRHAIDNLDSSIDHAADDGDTALHLCCLYGHTPCVQLLLEKGASVDSKDEDGAIPLHDACAGGFFDIVQLLLTAAGSQEHIRMLLETTDVDGDTPLHHAARGEHLEVVQLLLSTGASPVVTNAMGKKPGDLAEAGTEASRVLNAAAGTSNIL